MQNKKGFSFIELILILVFFFLILAALMPMITRRHLAPPERVSHGSYACYWGLAEDGTQILKETLTRGKHTIVDDQPAEGGVCRFEAPRKANYFYVQIIGGGGGGRRLRWSEVNPAAKADYRIFGRNSESSHMKGYFVKFGSGSNLHSAWQQTSPFKELTRDEYCDLFGGCTILGWVADKHYLYMYGATKNGLVYPNSYYISGDKEGSPVCRSADTDKNCSINPRTAGDKSYSTVNIGEGKHHYEFNCVDDGTLEHKCRYDSECTEDSLECDDGTTISFLPKTTTLPDRCGNIASDSFSRGSYGYARVLLNGAITSYLAGDKYFERVDANNTRCGYSSDLAYPVTATTTDAIRRFYDKGLKNMLPVKNPRTRAQQPGVWFKNRLGGFISGKDYVLYLCGGWPAEDAITVGRQNNKRKKETVPQDDAHCAPVYGKPNPTVSQQRDVYADLPFVDDSLISRNSASGANNTTSVASFLPGDVRDSDKPLLHDYQSLHMIQVNLWQTQEIPYGIGGRAGELKTLILKDIPDNVRMIPGKGGSIDANGIGLRGEDTFFGGGPDAEVPERVAHGGEGGQEIVAVKVNISPTLANGNKQGTGGKWDTKSAAGVSQAGGTITYSDFIKFVISYQNATMKARLQNFGRGGDGSYTETLATCGYDYEAIALYDQYKNPKIINSINKNNQKKYDAGSFEDPNNSTSSKRTFCGDYEWKKVPGTNDYDSTNPRIPTNGYSEGYYVRRGTTGANQSDHALVLRDNATAGYSGAIVISW